MTSPRIRVIEAPITEFAYLASRRSNKRKKWTILFVTSIRENCFPPGQFRALNRRCVWIKIHVRLPSNSSATSRDTIWTHLPWLSHSHGNSHVISIAATQLLENIFFLVFRRAYSWCKHRLDYGTTILRLRENRKLLRLHPLHESEKKEAATRTGKERRISEVSLLSPFGAWAWKRVFH